MQLYNSSLWSIIIKRYIYFTFHVFCDTTIFVPNIKRNIYSLIYLSD